MANQRLVKGLPKHFEKPPLWGRKQTFPWMHDLPGKAPGGIQYIPSLGVMCICQDVGNVQFRDPVSAEVLFDFLVTLVTDGAINAAFAPSANRLVIPIYENGSGNRIAILNLNTGEFLYISSLSAGTYDAAYCPTNDKVYVTAWQGNVIYVVDPWTDSIVASITGLGGITLGLCYSPLNDRIYATSRSANTAQRINPATNAVEANSPTGGAFDLCFFSNNLGKVVLMAAGSGLGTKTLDPLAADAVAVLHATGATAFSGVSIPTTGETCVEYSDLLRFYNPAGTNTANLNIAVNSAKYVGWNPITQQVWVAGNGSRQLWIIDPIRQPSSYQTFAVVRSI